mmetsp:Transcript_4961/g.11175  ORF Transcript_4961/g.11175 Transcript_4961/m.11175 type:complete len:85 (+) Transcript_4961:1240-1494(+)
MNAKCVLLGRLQDMEYKSQVDPITNFVSSDYVQATQMQWICFLCHVISSAQCLSYCHGMVNSFIMHTDANGLQSIHFFVCFSFF